MVEGYVYFIQAGDNGPVKIGWSKDPEKRLPFLQTANHERLYLRCVVEGNRDVERAFHDRFREALWEYLHPEAVEFERALREFPEDEAREIEAFAGTLLPPGTPELPKPHIEYAAFALVNGIPQ